MAAELAEFPETSIGALHAELHECLRLLRKIDAELEPARPLLRQFASPVSAAAAIRRVRRSG